RLQRTKVPMRARSCPARRPRHLNGTHLGRTIASRCLFRSARLLVDNIVLDRNREDLSRYGVLEDEANAASATGSATTPPATAAPPQHPRHSSTTPEDNAALRTCWPA